MFIAGKTVQEIADEENVSGGTVRGSLREEKVRRNLELRERVENENNRLRRRVQRELEDAFLYALKKLLQGQKEVPFSVSGGDIVSRFIEDPKALMLGIEQYRKTVSLEEKPAIGNNIYGFWINESSRNVFEENTAVANSLVGFILFDSDRNKFHYNTAAANSTDGFHLSNSDTNKFEENTATNNGDSGFVLFGSHNNTLTQNTADNNFFYGFNVSDTSELNTFRKNEGCGNGILDAVDFGIVTPGNNVWKKNNFCTSGAGIWHG